MDAKLYSKIADVSFSPYLFFIFGG